jgi:hypothetical protein
MFLQYVFIKFLKYVATKKLELGHFNKTASSTKDGSVKILQDDIATKRVHFES